MRLILISLVLLLLAACSHVPDYVPSYYRVPILQGNSITTKKLKQVKVGMTPGQVQYVLGTPMVKDTFSGNHWAYVFYYRNSHGVSREHQLDLYFEDGRLARISGSNRYKQLHADNKKTNQKPPTVNPAEIKS